MNQHKLKLIVPCMGILFITLLIIGLCIYAGKVISNNQGYARYQLELAISDAYKEGYTNGYIKSANQFIPLRNKIPKFIIDDNVTKKASDYGYAKSKELEGYLIR
jgi:hypothetical protein